MVISHIATSLYHDERLFLAILLISFHGLLQLGKLTFADKVDPCDYDKVTLHHTIKLASTSYSFLLPGHKADRFFEGNTIIIQKTSLPSNPHNFFLLYLTLRDHLHPLKPELWLHKSGIVLTHSWFIKKFQRFSPSGITGQSMHAGGATYLAEVGISPDII